MSIPFSVINILQIITLLLYFLGPINYFYGEKSIELLTLVLFFILSMNLGYFSARRIYVRDGNHDYRKFIRWCIIIGLIVSPLTFMYRVGGLNLNVTVGDLYSLARENKTDSVYLEYLRMLLSPFLFGLFPLLITYWNKISTKTKVFSLVVVTINLIVSIASGINQGLFLLIIIFFGLYTVNLKFKDIINVKNTIVALVFSMFIIFALNFFVEGQMTRSGSAAISGISYTQNYESDYDISDGKIKVLYSALTSYLTQGYRAFDLALELPFKTTFGVGHSSFLSRQVDRIFDTRISDNTYPARIERFGWDRYVFWSSFYLWWASDIHYIGVIVLMFVIGFVFRMVENSIKNEKSYRLIILYSYFLVMLFYLSANNQIFQSGESYIGFMFFFILFLRMKKYIRVR